MKIFRLESSSDVADRPPKQLARVVNVTMSHVCTRRNGFGGKDDVQRLMLLAADAVRAHGYKLNVCQVNNTLKSFNQRCVFNYSDA